MKHYLSMGKHALVCLTVLCVLLSSGCCLSEQIAGAGFETSVPCAPYRASVLLLADVPKDQSDALTLGTLQGLAANLTGEQILLKAGAYKQYMPKLESEWHVDVRPQDPDGNDWSLGSLLARFAGSLRGYILCDADLKKESAAVAVSLAHQLSAVVVTSANRTVAEKAGLSCLLDVTDKDDAWLRKSEYFKNCSTRIAVEQPMSMAPKLVDYAVMAGCYVHFYDGKDIKEHDRIFDFLDDGAVVIGWNNTLGEYQTVTSLSGMNAQMIPADHAFNLSTLSGFAMPEMKPKTQPDRGDGTAGQKHTVCFIMSDGDNLQWTLNDYTTGEKWYGSPLRGSFAMGWGLPATLIDLAAPMMSYFYNTSTAKDEFIMELSGLGYTYPSEWSDAARAKLAEQVASVMKRANLKYMEILDDHGFDIKKLSDFARQKEIEGIFYIDYSNYAGEGGKILWQDDTPVVSARYRLWAELEDGRIEEIAKKINAASTDPAKEDAYSFVIVHAWSGLDEKGKLGQNGKTMDAVKELISRFNGNVEVVTPSEFMARIRKHVKH